MNDFDLVVTLCGHANEACPYFPGRKIHVGFCDSPKFAADAKTEEEALVYYRRIRDVIRAFVAGLPDSME